MKGKTLFKLNKKTIGVVVVILTALYLLGTTAIAQDGNKYVQSTDITYSKDYLSYGDIWAFDSAAHTASNYSKANLGTSSYYSNSSNTNSGTTNFTRSFYSSVTTTERGAPTGTTVPSRAFTLFHNYTRQSTVPSPVEGGPDIPVIEATANNALYSVVPNSTGTYYVYTYSETGAPTTMYYSVIESPEVGSVHSGAGAVTTQPEFEDVGNNWYRAKIEVNAVKWHAVALNDPKKSGSSNAPSGVGTFSGGQDGDMSLMGGNTTYYYNQWTTTNIYYNTVIVFKFANVNANVKLGPITKAGDTITITNTDPAKGNVTAKTVFGQEIAVGQAAAIDHCPVIITPEPAEGFTINEVELTKGEGELNASGDSYVYSFEEPSELSVTWTKMVNLPTISVAGGASNINMNFFGAKTASFTHPAGTERNYTFTAHFDNASDLESLAYSYTITDLAGKTEIRTGTLTESENSFSVVDVCYQQIKVTFTARDQEGSTFTATCTIDLSAVNATAPFRVGSAYYLTWEQAVTAAGNSGTVILNNDYTLPNSLLGNGLLGNGSYVVESNGGLEYRYRGASMTFIVPHADGASSVNASNHLHPYACETQGTGGATALMANVYRTLTLSSGTTIQVSGTMAVGGTTNGSGQIAGAHANIHLEEDAKINVAGDARLTTCGYIYGEGTVNAENKSTVYMPFSVLDFRGGGYTVGVAGQVASSYGISNHPSGEKGLSPFLRYTMNAVQSKLVINPGATLQGYLDLYADGTHNNTNATIIGTSEGLIVTTSGTTVEATYDADTYISTYATLGKTTLKISGDAKFGNLALTITDPIRATINTNQVNFPIPYNFDLEIASGTFTVPYSVMLLPGSSVIVEEGATLDMNASLTVYDGLHDYTAGPNTAGRAILSGYESESQSDYKVTPSSNYPSTADLRSATFGGSGSADLVVNGTLNLNSGAKIGGVVQTSSDGAARIVVNGNVTTKTTTQIGAVGSWSYLGLRTYYFAGATTRELPGQIIDTATGERIDIVPGLTYQPSAGAANISSYTYNLYYDSNRTNTPITEDVACILQGSWYNYAVKVYTVLDKQVSKEPITMYFAHGAKLPENYYYDETGSSKATEVTDNRDLYFIGEAEAKVVWADGSEPTLYPIVRGAVTDAVHKGDKVVLLKDLPDFSTVIGPSATQDFIFDMDGHVINYRSTPFASNAGGNMTVNVNHGTITNVVNNTPYDNPVVLVGDDSSLTIHLDGGTVSVEGNGEHPLTKSSAVSNSGDLTIDLGGGKWSYLTGLAVPKASNEAGTQHHDLTVLAPYQSMAAINNTGTLTIADTSESGDGTFITDLTSSGATLTPATPTTNYVSVIRNNADATLYLDGGKLMLKPIEDVDHEPILSTAATPIPMALYSAVVVNFGDVKSHDTGSAMSMTGSGAYILYNFVGGTVDLDLRGGTIEHTAYAAGVKVNAAMYNGKAAIVNDGVMTLRDSTGKGIITTNLSTTGTTTNMINAVRNSPNSALPATLTLDGVNIQTTQTDNNNSCGLYNFPNGTITGIQDTTITSALGYAVYSPGTAALPSKIGDITGSTFKAGTTEGVVGTHGFYTAFTTIGNITGSTFENESTASNMTALRAEGNAATLTKVGDITDSHIKGGVYGFYGTYVSVGKITNSTFTGGTNYALAAVSYSNIESITGGAINTAEGGTSGGLTLTGTAATATALRFVSTIPGGITGTQFDVTTIGINLSHAQIGDLNSVNITTKTGNGITGTNGSIIGDIIDSEINSGAIGLSTASFTAAAAAPESIAPQVGNITGTTINAGTGGINLNGQAANAYTAIGVAPTIGDIIDTTINAGTYCLSSAGVVPNANGAGAAATVGKIEDSHFNSVTPANNTYVLNNTNSSIEYIKDTEFNVTYPVSKVNAINNVGGQIGSIENCEINAPYGIYNQNTLGNAATTDGGATIAFYGRIETIKDTNITVAQYAIRNYGVVGEIIGKCTFVAANPSAQVPWDHGNITAGNAQAYTVVNYNGWWGTGTAWKQTDETVDGHLTRTIEYKWEDDYRPRIGKISGDIQIIALNTSTNVAHGVALQNNGVINEISGNVLIDTHVHESNTLAYSSYALQNTSGGRIDKITGNVKITAGAYALTNSLGTIYKKNVTTYTASTVNDNQATDWTREFQYDYTGIGEITGNGDQGIIIEATASGVAAYALQNTARIGDITGKVTITADNGALAIQNSTGTTANIISTLKTTPDKQKELYEEFMAASMGVIGGGDSEILIRADGGINNNTLYNSGVIEAILDGVTVETKTGYNNAPTIVNGSAAVMASRKQVLSVLGASATAGEFDSMTERDYKYHRVTIGEIRGVTVKTAMNYALRNWGYIGSITDSSFTAATGYGIVNYINNQYLYASSQAGEVTRHTEQYYHGATPIALGSGVSGGTQYFGETAIWYINEPAEIGSMDGVTIEVTGGSYGLHNLGEIGPITNTSITVSGSYAIHNLTRPYALSYEVTMDGYITNNGSGYAANAITDSVTEYPVPTIDSISEGVKLQAAARTLENGGEIGSIVGGETEDTRVSIIATSDTGSNQHAIFNYGGVISLVERDGAATDINTYTSAKIGVIQNASIENVITPAIQNGNNTANYIPLIGEIGEGTEVYSAGGHAVYNYVANANNHAQIEKITGGIFTTGASGNFYALYNASPYNATATAYPIELTGGDFKSGSGDRDHAIYQPDNTTVTRYTYPEGYYLSHITEDVTFADGTPGTEYYFITTDGLILIFEGNGATEGEMEQLVISLDEDNLAETITLPENLFHFIIQNESDSPDEPAELTFLGWVTVETASEAELQDQWSGTVQELIELLKELLDLEEIPTGTKLTLYAVWNMEDPGTYTIAWGDLDFTYTRPTYFWDAENMRYELDTEGSWSATGESEPTITVTVEGESGYQAKLTYTSSEGYDFGMTFTGQDEVEVTADNIFTIPGNAAATVQAMLTGEPDDGEADHALVGTVSVEITKLEEEGISDVGPTP